MNISKVYYEELKSKCVGGKWESVRIGAEVIVDNEFGENTIDYGLEYAKSVVRDKLKKEGFIGIKDNSKLKKLLDEIREEIKATL